MGKQLLLTSSQLSILDTMPAFLIRNMVSMQLFHKRTICAIQSAFDDVANTPIDSYFSQ